MPRLCLQRYLITGLLTFIPLSLTWLVVNSDTGATIRLAISATRIRRGRCR